MKLPARSSGSEPGRTRASGARSSKGARKLFLEEGFDAASMADIARRAGVSKGTLYVYFDSKERLFVELVHLEKVNQAEAIFGIDPENHDVGAMLRQVGIGFIEFLTSPHVTRSMRTVIAIGERMEGVGAEFYRDGPLLCSKKLSGYLQAQVEAGLLATDNTILAASQFLDMCKSTLVLPLLFGAANAPTRPEIEAVVEFGGEGVPRCLWDRQDGFLCIRNRQSLETRRYRLMVPN